MSAYGSGGLVSGYTGLKVHRPLAALLDVLAAPEGLEQQQCDRFSNETGGLLGQVQRHCAIYPGDPDVEAYRGLAAGDLEAGRAGRAFVLAGFPGVRIAPADIHPTLSDMRPCIVGVRIGRTIFWRIEMSAVAASIVREDGEDENAYTSFLLQAVNHLSGRGLRVTRWADDVTRAARESINWGLLMRRHQARSVLLALAGTRYDMSLKADRVALKLLGALGSEDDPERRRKLVGGRLVKLLNGGAGVAEDQMPVGWRLARNDRGQALRDPDRGQVPIADHGLAAVLQDVYGRFAAGERFDGILAALIGHETQGLIRRRSGQRYRLTFAEAAGDPTKAHDAALSVFAGRTAKPDGYLGRAAAPSEELIARYLAGEDPAALFTIAQRDLISRVELVRTAKYLRTLKSDLVGRGTVVAGIAAQYAGEGDERGYFVVEPTWPWPVDPATGLEVERFGIDDATCRQAGARLLRSLRPPRRQGGRAQERPEPRAISAFDPWIEDGTEWGLIARDNTGGKHNVIVLSRPEPDGRAPDGPGPVPAGGGSGDAAAAEAGNDGGGSGAAVARRGWTMELGNPREFVRGTFSLHALCQDVAIQAQAAVEAAMLGDRVARAAATVVTRRQADESTARARLLSLADDADARAQESAKAQAGARRLASLAAGDGLDDEASALMADAREHGAAASRAQGHASALRAQAAADQPAGPGGQDPDDPAADASIAAYLVAGLTRASRNQGRTGPGVAAAAARHLGNWRVRPVSDGTDRYIQWSCVMTLPLVDGGSAGIPLAGRIRNVRREQRHGDDTKRIVAVTTAFRDGRTLDEAALAADTSVQGLIAHYVGPWLTSAGLTRRGLRGALMRHPLGYVRQALHAHVDPDAGASPALRPYAPAYLAHLAATYASDQQWGDGPVPDDLALHHQVAATLAAPAARGPQGVRLEELANAAGVGVQTLRARLVVPTQRTAGFIRPAYAEYASPAKDRIRLIRCPHPRCQGLCDAVVLLPEVAASGYGVICRTCRRAPNTTDARWKSIVFPPDYLTPLSLERTPGRAGSNALPADPAIPLAVTT